MSKTFKPVKMEDLGLKPGELKTIVEGAQVFLAPMEDFLDSEKLKPEVDSGEQSLTS